MFRVYVGIRGKERQCSLGVGVIKAEKRVGG